MDFAAALRARTATTPTPTPTSSSRTRNILIVALDPAVIRAFSDALDGVPEGRPYLIRYLSRRLGRERVVALKRAQ